MNVLAKVRRRYTSLLLLTTVVLSVLLCGCSANKNTSDESSLCDFHGQYWKSTSYTFDEINAKFHPKYYNDERVLKADDISEDALNAYNAMLGYAEKILGQDYYVYDYYYADWTEPPKSWLIKVVPYEMARAAEAEGRDCLYTTEPLCLHYCEDGSEVISGIEPYYMARRWFDDLKRDMAESFPDYFVELEITEFEGIYPNVLKDKFPETDDYTYIINDSFYAKQGEWEYGNIINVMVPAGTKQSDAAVIFEQIKPLLRRYCVTEVYLFAPTTKEVFDSWAADEDKYSVLDNLDWEEQFTIQTLGA